MLFRRVLHAVHSFNCLARECRADLPLASRLAAIRAYTVTPLLIAQSP